MEEDIIFHGGGVGARILSGMASALSKAAKALGLKKFSLDGRLSPARTSINAKARAQTGRFSATPGSKLDIQSKALASFKKGKAASVETRGLDAQRAIADDVKLEFENPTFKEKLSKTIGAKEASFGKSLTPDELRVKVDEAMNRIRQNAELKARSAAGDARGRLSDLNNKITLNGRQTLLGKIRELKDAFNRGNTGPGGPGRNLDVPDINDINPRSRGALDDANLRNLEANRVSADSGRFNDASARARNSADNINNPRNRGDNGTGESGRGESGRGESADPDDARLNSRDALDDANLRRLEGDRVRGDSGRFDDASNRARNSGNEITNPRDGGRGNGDGTSRMDDGRLDEPDSLDAKNRADNSLNASRSLLDRVKNFLGRVADGLKRVLLMVLPFLLTFVAGPRTPRPTGTIPTFFPTFNFRPPVINPYEDKDYDVDPLYIADKAQPPGAGDEFVYEYESFGNIVFQLTEQPYETVSFQVISLSESLEFDENIVTFPLENWSAPVYLNFISDLQTSSDQIIEDINEDVSEKLNRLKQEKRVDKRPNITIGSLDDYSTTNEEINARRNRLEYMLRPSETIQQALAKINKRVQMRESLVEPTYGGGYSEYRGIVEPTYESEMSEEQVEPTYDDSEYKIQEDKVYPSEKIIREETYEPIEEVVDPTYDDSEYKDYSEVVVPTLDGGQEDEYYDEYYDEYNIPDLDYDTIVSRIDETQLNDNYKAEIEFILLEEISSEVNIVVSVLDPTWTVKPNIISFDRETPSTTSFFFSQEIYQTLQGLYAEQYSNQVENKFNNYLENEYETTMDYISNQENINRQMEDELYNDTYDKVYQQELSKASDAEYVLRQLGGYTKPTVSNLFKRTRKLPRVIK